MSTSILKPSHVFVKNLQLDKDLQPHIHVYILLRFWSLSLASSNLISLTSASTITSWFVERILSKFLLIYWK